MLFETYFMKQWNCPIAVIVFLT